MAHSRAHSHSHSHHDAGSMSEGRLILSLLLTMSFVVVETIGGIQSHSLALLSDAGHNFTDAFALLLSWYAIWIARKPATQSKTYGYHRVGILTALLNAVTLVVIAVLIFLEAFHLFAHPHQIHSVPMVVIAACAVLMNTVIAMWLHGAAKDSLNMRSAFIHMLGDAISSAGVVVAGLVIHFTGWQYADPIASLLIGGFIIYSSWGIVLEAVNVLLEGAPRGVDMTSLVQAMRDIPGVDDVHDLHVWTIGDGMNALSCHLHVEEAEPVRIRGVVHTVKSMLATQYSVKHSTIETECAGCEASELYCIMSPVESECDHAH